MTNSDKHILFEQAREYRIKEGWSDEDIADWLGEEGMSWEDTNNICNEIDQEYGEIMQAKLEDIDK